MRINAERITLIIGSGNNYSKFISQLFMTKEELDYQSLSTKDIFDEEGLVNVLGTSSNLEIKLFSDYFFKQRNITLSDYIDSKLKHESPLKEFLKRIIKCNRQESTTIKESLVSQSLFHPNNNNTDKELAFKQATEIHKVTMTIIIIIIIIITIIITIMITIKSNPLLLLLLLLLTFTVFLSLLFLLFICCYYYYYYYYLYVVVIIIYVTIIPGRSSAFVRSGRGNHF